MKKYTSDIKP